MTHSIPSAPSKKRVLILLADGARHDLFQELLEAGELPHVEEAFLQDGTFARAASVFPSTTGPAYLPFLTGCFPGTCNVPGIRWFDKKNFAGKKLSRNRYRSYVGFESFLLNRDIHREIKTLFDFLPKSYSIFSSVNRGVPASGNLTAFIRIWYFYYAHLTDRWQMVDDVAVEKALKVIKKDFEFLFLLLPGIDEYSHLSHPRNKGVLEAYRSLDRSVGKLVKGLKSEGKWDETLFCIVSDHGLSETKRHFGVASFLEDKGFKTFYYPKIFKWGFDAVSMPSGNAMLHLYLKEPEGWGRRLPREGIEELSPGLMTSLLENPAVDLLLCQGIDEWVHVLSRKGECKVQEKEGVIDYRLLKGNPLGIPGPAGRWNSRQAFEATLQTDYPDSLAQITQIFRSPRTGDMVLSAAPGYDLRKRFEHPEHKSSHGALHHEHIWTPLLSNVRMNRPDVRTADLFPSVLKLLGIVSPDGLDGESFF